MAGFFIAGSEKYEMSEFPDFDKQSGLITAVVQDAVSGRVLMVGYMNREAFNKTMEEGAGIYRTESSLKKTCDDIRRLKERYRNVGISDRTNSFNTELTTVLELGFMLDAAEAVAYSALARQESRGSHQRVDFPARDDQRYLKHSLAFRTDGEPRIDYLDVVITKWPPAERVYGKT